MAYYVRTAHSADVQSVYDLLEAAGLHLMLQGYNNWAQPYPQERIEADIAQGVVFLVCPAHHADVPVQTDQGPVATFMLRSRPVHEYKPPPWPVPELSAAYLNRLAVDPGLHGQGIGTWCLRYLETMVGAEGINAIRCDVLTANLPLRRFYERAGYTPYGTREHSGWEFTCYERVVA